MSPKDRYIAGVPCWVDTGQADLPAAVDFYGALFEWEGEDVMADAPGGPYFIARLHSGDVGAIAARRDEGAPSWRSYVWVADADGTTAKICSAGGGVLVEPSDVGEAGRMAVVHDTEGATFSLWQPDPQGAVFTANPFVPPNRDAGQAEPVAATAA